MKTGKDLLLWRTLFGISQTYFANTIGYARSTISRTERKNEKITKRMLNAIKKNKESFPEVAINALENVFSKPVQKQMNIVSDKNANTNSTECTQAEQESKNDEIFYSPELKLLNSTFSKYKEYNSAKELKNIALSFCDLITIKKNSKDYFVYWDVFKFLEKTLRLLVQIKNSGVDKTMNEDAIKELSKACTEYLNSRTKNK